MSVYEFIYYSFIKFVLLKWLKKTQSTFQKTQVRVAIMQTRVMSREFFVNLPAAVGMQHKLMSLFSGMTLL